MLDIVPADRDLDFLEICEGFRVIHGDTLSGFPELVAPLKLLDANRSRNVRQVVFESRVENFVVPRTFLGIAFPSVMADPVETHYPHSLCPFRVLCRRHPAFAGGDRFGRVEGKTGDIANHTYGPTVMASWQGMSRI